MSNPSNPYNPCKASRILDEEFLTIRAKLIDIAAALDRIDRAAGPNGFTPADSDMRMKQIRQSVAQLLEPVADRTERIQMFFSLPFDE